MVKINCAIYTRKSTEEGLDQEYNSLENQFDSAKAYIESQKHDGWKFYKRYDDGGFTGANTKRPGLQQLLNDIEKGYVQCVVVYKVDRLSRSLIDFSKMMEIFDAKEVSFVSVTQHFNTSSSMGKLTLNVLLSFAQFEREVTGERIRDKIANSRKKGMWMGGNVPYGFKLDNKKLYINPKEAEVVKYIFESYLLAPSIMELKYKLNEEGYRTRTGKLWCHGALGRVLKNPTYIGRVRHKKNVYDGIQEGFVKEDLWTQVQAKLADNMNRDSDNLVVGRYLLFKKLYNSNGEMYRCDACIKNTKNKKVRHEYYVSDQRRFKTRKIDEVVTESLKEFIKIGSLLEREELDELAKINWNKLTFEQRRSFMQYLISKVILDGDEIRIEIEREKIIHLQKWQGVEIQQGTEELENVYLSSSGKVINIVTSFDKVRVRTIGMNNSLLWNIAKGYQYREWLESGISLINISKKENKQDGYIMRILKLGYLSPKIIEAVVDGNYTDEFNLDRLREVSEEIAWEEQERKIEGFSV